MEPTRRQFRTCSAEDLVTTLWGREAEVAKAKYEAELEAARLAWVAEAAWVRVTRKWATKHRGS